MGRTTRTAAPLLAAVLLVVVSACGSDPAPKSVDEHRSTRAADRSVCAAAATAAATPYGGQFPQDWPFPPGTTVYDVEDRGDQGTIVTAISTTPFRGILDFLNGDVTRAGFHVESGETEEHDAEAEWAGNGHRGRWAIRESATCPGETVIQVLAARSAG